MKYLKLFKESVNDTKEQIEEIVSTCKDIMLEAQHTFGNSDVEKSYKDDKVIINCFYKMPFDMKGKLEEYKSAMDDIHSRLIEYMISQGFTYINRGDRYTAYFDMRLGNITYNISFSKELDKEFIGHLRYLKKYNLLKESNNINNIISECKDILLEVSDKDVEYKVYGYKGAKVLNEETFVDVIRVELGDQWKTFKIGDMYLMFEHLFSYLESEGFNLGKNSYLENSNWEYHEACPECDSGDVRPPDNLHSMEGWMCNKCKHAGHQDEFQRPEHPTDKKDLFWSIKQNYHVQFMSLSFYKNV